MKSSRVCMGLLVAECVLVIVSWLLSAARIEGVRSMLSSEGIRWFFGGFSNIIANPLLAWLLLALIAGGSLKQSGVLRHFTARGEASFRNRLALRVAIVFVVLYALVISMLTLMPHAILLSFSGHLFPSAFSRGLVPIICFGIVLLALSYGAVSGMLPSLASMLSALSFGLQQSAPFIILYIFFIQFYESLWFVFG